MRSPLVSPTMIGRQADIETLHDEFRRSVIEPRAVVIGGEAGIGKTRLVSEFGSAVADEAIVLVGRCLDFGDEVPFAPFTAILRSLLERLGTDAVLEAAGPGRGVLTVLLPELSGIQGMPARTGAERLYESAAVLLESVAREHRLVIVIEDLHWADSASLQLIRFLVRALGGADILFVMTLRSEEVPRGHSLRTVLPELERTRRLARWDLTRLPRELVAAQVEAIRGKRPDGDTLERLYERSEGVPFFVEELIEVDGAVPDAGLPDTLRSLLLTRYERLADPTQQLLRLIAAGGSCVSHDRVAQVFDGTPAELDAGVREAMDAGILLVDGEQYCFRHALVREAVHDDLLPGERVRFHACYAEAYESRPGTGAAAALSYHRMAAHDPVRAFPATLEAMRQARATYAHAAAARMGERAIELWDQVPDAEAVAACGRIELLQQTAVALRDAGEGERALALVGAALDEYSGDDAHVVAGLMRDKALYLAALSRPGSTAILEQALAGLPLQPHSEVRALLTNDLAGRLMLEARYDEAVEAATVALKEATSAGSLSRMSIAHNLRGVALVGRGDIERGLLDLDEAHRLAENRDGAMLRYRVNASDVMHLIGRYDEAMQIGEAGRDRARELGVERTSGVMLAANTAEPLIALGEWDRAEALLGPALALDPAPGFRVHLQRLTLWLKLWRGHPLEAASTLKAWHGQIGAQGEIEMQSRLGFARVAAEIALANGDLEHAAVAIETLLEPRHRVMSGYDLPLLAVAASVLARMRRSAGRAGGAPTLGGGPLGGHRDPDAVETALRVVLEQSESWPTAPVWMPVFEAELSGPEGTGTDPDAWRIAAEAAEAERAPAHLRPYVLFRLARSRLEAGDRTRAHDAACRARSDAGHLGAGLLLEWIDELALRAGFDLTDVPSADRGPALSGPGTVQRLTEREAQVLELIGEGLSNKQIGERLFISAKTASVHVSAILRKLEASSRTEAAYLARRTAATGR
ncbi:MAG TPA: AAA family ATPase [Humibacter sp.]|nr:AAA family ATPase [Humibacter sp.]